MIRIAIPIADGKLCAHFGHCETFALLEVDKTTHSIIKREDLVPPPHEPGVLPRWLAENRVNLIIAGGMGQRAHELFKGQGILVVVGAPANTPETLVNSYFDNTLITGANLCDH